MEKDSNEMYFSNRIDLINWLIKHIWEVDLLKLEKSEKFKDRRYYIIYRRIAK